MFSGPDFIAYLSDRAQNNRQFQVIILVYEPRHGKMCLRDKFGHFEILWFLDRSSYDE